MLKKLKGFRSRLQRFFKTELFAAFSTTTFTTGIQMVTGLVVNKVIAVTIGPSGIAFVGQFVNFKVLLTNLASGSFQSGLTKYVADPDYSTPKVIATSNIFSLLLSIILGLSVALTSNWLSYFLLKDSGYAYIFVIFGFLLPFFSLNTLLIGTVNGFRNFKVLAYLKVTNNVVALVLSTFLVLTYQLKGALLAHAINTSLVFIISLIVIHYYFSFSQLISFKLSDFDKGLLIKLLAFTLMALTSTQLKPFVQLFIRDYIMQKGGEIEAGIWQAMISLSKHYMDVITVALGVYYLPKLSSLSDNIEIRREIFRGFKFIIPFFLVLAVTIYFTRHWTIILLYSKDFFEMKKLFLPQLIGDFFMIFSFLISYMLLAKSMVKLFMSSQIFFALTRIILSLLLYNYLGIIGVIWANAINYFLYSIFLIIVFRNLLFNFKSRLT